MSYVIQELCDEIGKLKQALAEKDQEIAKWKAAHAEMVSRNKLLRDRPDLPADRIQAHDEWVEKYQQLMEKAVRFAEAYHNAHLSNLIDLVAEEMAEDMAAKDPVYVEARDFVKENRIQYPEVQVSEERT